MTELTNPVPVQQPIVEPTTEEPISRRTRSQLANLVTNGTPHGAARRQYPRNFLLDWAMPVLDEETGKTLEYGQLRKHPKYQKVWNESYSNELGRLYQGVRSGKKGPLQQRTEGTGTFNIIDFNDTPLD